MKKCTKCKVEKPLTKFGKGNGQDGLDYWCKECNSKQAREYHHKHREERLAYKKKYYQKNKEEILNKRKEYYLNNIEKRKRYDKLYNQKNKDQNKQRHREWYAKNKEVDDEIHRKYREENREWYGEYLRSWCRKNKEKTKKWRAENKYKIRKWDAEAHSKRKRNLGFTELCPNPFDEAEAIDWHHINDEVVIPIPRDIHQHFNNRGTAQHRDLLEFVALQVVSLVDEDKLLTWAGG